MKEAGSTMKEAESTMKEAGSNSLASMTLSHILEQPYNRSGQPDKVDLYTVKNYRYIKGIKGVFLVVKIVYPIEGI